MVLPLVAILGALAAGGLGAATHIGNRNVREGVTETGGVWGALEGIGANERKYGSSAYEARGNQGPVNDSPYRRGGSRYGQPVRGGTTPVSSITDLMSGNLSGLPSYENYLEGIGLNQGMLDQVMNSIMNGGSSTNYLGQPRDVSQDWINQIGQIYGPQVDYAKSVIPYLETRGENAKGEIQDLYNIAEETLNQSSSDVRSGGQEAAAAQAQNIASIVDAMQGDTAATEADYLAELEKLGIGNTAFDQASEVGQEQAELLGREGALVNNNMAADSAATADYLSELAATQDTAAAATVADMANQINDLIFQQQGRITDIQSQQNAASLDAMMQGRNDYLRQVEMAMSGDQNRIGNFINMANLGRGLYGDYYGYADTADQRNMQLQQMLMEMGGGAEGEEYAPPVDYVQAVERASNGNPTIKQALVVHGSVAADLAIEGDITQAVKHLVQNGVPEANANDFVFAMMGVYG
jgi:hypothetical protein